jgi:hypothetical protein
LKLTLSLNALAGLSALALFALPTAALADRAKADECAKGLSGEALNTYKAGIQLAENNATLEQAITPYLKPLHDAGKITEEEARKVGRAAAECMRLVHGAPMKEDAAK